MGRQGSLIEGNITELRVSFLAKEHNFAFKFPEGGGGANAPCQEGYSSPAIYLAPSICFLLS